MFGKNVVFMICVVFIDGYYVKYSKIKKKLIVVENWFS